MGISLTILVQVSVVYDNPYAGSGPVVLQPIGPTTHWSYDPNPNPNPTLTLSLSLTLTLTQP